DLLALRHLAQYLAPDQPFYGLQPPSRPLPAVVLPGITDLAVSYIDALRTIQPAGPYCLGGYSAGGLVAFEMAQQLWQQGQRVCLLALLDTSYRFTVLEYIVYGFLERLVITSRFLRVIGRLGVHGLHAVLQSAFMDEGLKT